VRDKTIQIWTIKEEKQRRDYVQDGVLDNGEYTCREIGNKNNGGKIDQQDRDGRGRREKLQRDERRTENDGEKNEIGARNGEDKIDALNKRERCCLS